MPADPLLDNGQTVEALADALRSGKSGLTNVPGLVKVVIRDRCWAERAVGADHRRVAYQDFVRFVTDAPLEGLGTDVQTLERLCADDVEAIRLIAEAKVQPVGGDRMTTHSIRRDGDAAPSYGTTAEYAIRVLANQFPELYEEVKAGRMSPHRAAVQAGIRKQTVTVEAGTFGFARYIKKHFTRDQIEDLISALREN
jgi:hypothetical protein